SAFNSAQDDALDEVFLPDQEDDEDRQQHQGRGRHQQVHVRVVLALKEAQADRQGEMLRAVEIDQRSQKVVPVADEGEDRDGHEDRFAERQQNVPVDSEGGAAVYPGGFVQFARQGQIELAEQEDEERPAAQE